MNYITQLKGQVEALEMTAAKNGEVINELRRYLNSIKFQMDTTVQVSDVLSRLIDLDLPTLTPLERIIEKAKTFGATYYYWQSTYRHSLRLKDQNTVYFNSLEEIGEYMVTMKV